MIFNISRIPHRALGIACAVAALVSFPAAAPAASAPTTITDKALGIQIPASARVHGATTTTPTTTTPATSSTPAATTPTATAPASTTPTSGAQPGTVAPATTTPTPGLATPTTTTPAPTIGSPAHIPAPGSTVIVGAARKPASKSTRLSTGALALAVLGALLVLGCLIWALSRWLALEPRWTIALMHSLREASYRASATWAEFTDWVRLGH
jgi:hypothetical protein